MNGKHDQLNAINKASTLIKKKDENTNCCESFIQTPNMIGPNATPKKRIIE